MTDEINAIQIGGLAQDALNTYQQGQVVGITSKGIFLNLQNKILFITDAAYKSPYNVQISGLNALSEAITTGEPFFVEGKDILFKDKFRKIRVASARVWQPEPPDGGINPRKIQEERFQKVIESMHQLDSTKGWMFLAGLDSIEPESEKDRIRKITSKFVECYLESDLAGCLDAAKSITGLGGGLTPSGDDWLTGFILYHVRSDQSQGIKREYVNQLGNSLAELAFNRTTKISANRIEAACTGWAEELFLELIDHIVLTDKVFGERKINQIVNFGHSSGVDTSIGIYAAWQTTS